VLQFSAYDLGERALAWIVEERALRAALLPRCTRRRRVLGDAGFASLTWSTDDATLGLASGEALSARSSSAPTASIRGCARPRAGRRAEAVRPDRRGGAFRMRARASRRGAAMVLRRRRRARLAALARAARLDRVVGARCAGRGAACLSAAELAARVAAAGGNALGRFTPLGPASGFPLQFLRLPTSVAHRLALVGDAAHGLHPLAGQGVNLGFGDAEALSDVLAGRGPVDDPGAPALLTRYARRRAEPVLAMQAVTDGLARLFGTRMPWVRVLRNFGLSAVDRLPVVKRALAQPALR
jgi:2-polyprenyl-6-methoxyphenol hydroxylase-like FAD-dependent oxidoreductase